MAKFNSAAARTEVVQEQIETARTKSPIKVKGRISNEAGNEGYERKAKGELFLLAVSNFVGENTFYESADNRDNRFAELCRKVAVKDVAWFTNFVTWLRNEGNMRSASLVASAEGTKALLDAGVLNGSPRALVASSMARADEPGEFLAYWTSKYGKNLPQAVKKGVADAAVKLYSEYSLLKYDTASKGFRFADVLQLTHAKTSDRAQNDLFQYALNRRYGNDGIADSLEMITSRKALMAMQGKYAPARLLENTEFAVNMFKSAGMTWEALPSWIDGPMDKKAWEAVIPSMGYMALLRNLRNFLEAGVSAESLGKVLNKLEDPVQVAKSKQFPFRFLSAYNANKGNLMVAAVLEKALQASLANVPVLSGRTLILVDRSGSMFGYGYNQTELDNADKAAIFGTALALRAEDATLVQFGSNSEVVKIRKGDSILTTLDNFKDLGGTSTYAAIKSHFSGHDRVIVVTDEQYTYGTAPEKAVPADVPMYTWNLVGYRAGQSGSGSDNRHAFGGLTDKGFQMIPMIEAGQSQSWPWDVAK